MARASDGYGILVDELIPATGEGRIYALGSSTGWNGVPALLDYISWTGPAWSDTGVCPCAWALVPPLSDRGTYTLVIIAAPQVRINREYRATRACDGCHYPDEPIYPNLTVFVIRTTSIDVVPQPGDRIDYDAFLQTRYHREDGSLIEDAMASPPARSIAVKQLPSGVAIQHESEHWQVLAKARSDDEPSGYSLLLFPDPMAYAVPRARSVINVAFNRAESVSLSGTQQTSLMVLDPRTFHEVRLYEDQVYRLDQIPLPEPPVPRVSGKLITTATQYVGVSWWLVLFANTAPTVAYLVLSFLPGVGEILDVAEMASIALRGKDLLGDDAGAGSFTLAGASLIAGPVLEGAENARKVQKSIDELGLNVKVFDDLGNMPPALKREMLEQTSPIVKAATNSLGTADQAKLAGGLAKAATEKDVVKAADTVKEVIDAGVDRLVKSGDFVPSPIVADLTHDIHPAHIANFAELSTETKYVVNVAVDGMRRTADAVGPDTLKLYDDGLSIMRIADQQFWDEYVELVEEAAVYRLITPLGDNFRHPVLRDGYQHYKRAKGDDALSPLKWLSYQSGKSRYRKVLTSHLGDNGYQNVKRVLDGKGQRMTRVTAENIDEAVRVLEAIGMERAGMIFTYRALREHTKGVGRVLEVDHMLEKRFEKLFGTFTIPRDDIMSTIVPKNAWIREELAKRGWTDFSYDHLTKTRLMNRYIPHHREEFFTVEEIYMAHELVLVHELGLPPKQFTAIMDDLCIKLAQSRGRRFTPKSTPSNVARATLAQTAQRTEPAVIWLRDPDPDLLGFEIPPDVLSYMRATAL